MEPLHPSVQKLSLALCPCHPRTVPELADGLNVGRRSIAAGMEQLAARGIVRRDGPGYVLTKEGNA